MLEPPPRSAVNTQNWGGVFLLRGLFLGFDSLSEESIRTGNVRRGARPPCARRALWRWARNQSSSYHARCPCWRRILSARLRLWTNGSPNGQNSYRSG